MVRRGELNAGNYLHLQFAFALQVFILRFCPCGFEEERERRTKGRRGPEGSHANRAGAKRLPFYGDKKERPKAPEGASDQEGLREHVYSEESFQRIVITFLYGRCNTILLSERTEPVELHYFNEGMFQLTV